MAANPYPRFYAIIRKIPRGRVATYGQIARLAGLPAHARQVGYALSASSDERLPWHRVVNAQGGISPRGTPDYAERQRARLAQEHVVFERHGRINLARFQWARGSVFHGLISGKPRPLDHRRDPVRRKTSLI